MGVWWCRACLNADDLKSERPPPLIPPHKGEGNSTEFIFKSTFLILIAQWLAGFQHVGNAVQRADVVYKAHEAVAFQLQHFILS